MRSRIFLGTLFGAVGGFIGFLLQEVLISHHDGLTRPIDVMWIGIYFGALLGMALGSVEGVATGSNSRLFKGAVLGTCIGVIGGLFGAYFGSIVFTILSFGKTQEEMQQPGLLNFIQTVIARSMGWALLGAFPGLAAGAATLSPKRALHGLAGGLIGGFLGGLVFDLIGNLLTPTLAPAAAVANRNQFEVGGPSRAIGFTAIGLFSGLFIGLVEEMLKQAWVRVLAGKNEGKDYIISKGMTVLGRDERADIPLFGDPSLAPQHAAIKLENNRHTLLDGGGPAGSIVNGQRVTQQLLKDGDMIQLGQVRILFREKATANRISAPGKSDAPKSPQAASSVSMPSHLCPFCGAQKDAQGNCLCTVPGAGAPPMGNTVGYQQPPSGVSLNYGDPMGYSNQSYSPPVQQGYDPLADPMAPPQYSNVPPNHTGYGYSPQPVDYGMSGGGVGNRITALDGPYAGQSFMLTPGENTLGRAPENTIPMVNDSTISRRHANFMFSGTGYIVSDVGSSNGTYVNGVRITSQPLVLGDMLQIGGSKFRFE